MPEPVDLSPAETAAALSNRELLAQLGIEVESFGGGTLLISSYPAMLAKLRPADLLRTLVERLLDGGKSPDRRDLLDELLHMIACKAAIKAGDRLTPEEVAALVEQRHLAQDAHHCPARPPDGAGVHPRRSRPAIQADITTVQSDRAQARMSRRDKRIERMCAGAESIRFSAVVALLEYEGFVLFNSRGSHFTFHRGDGRVLTIVRPHGGRKTCHPADVKQILEVLEL